MAAHFARGKGTPKLPEVVFIETYVPRWRLYGRTCHQHRATTRAEPLPHHRMAVEPHGGGHESAALRLAEYPR